jgi:23S rRNA (pseudouridine1915-N3)-methyltransferase
MLKITLVAVGKIKEKFWQTAMDEYVKRLKPYTVLNFVEIKAESFSNQNKKQAQASENQRLINALEKYNKQNIYLLAEAGQEFDSLKFAKFIASQSEIILVIGGALGWAEEIKQKYPQSISLSQLTMPHEMARVVLLEQVYRATTILNNKEYHY